MQMFRANFQRILAKSVSVVIDSPDFLPRYQLIKTYLNTMASAKVCSPIKSSDDSSPVKKQRLEEKPKLKFTKVVPEAHAPVKGSPLAAGFDLRSAFDYVVQARGKALVDTGLKVELPQGCYGRVAPRSGLAVKNFIDVGAGVIDEDYRGIVKVVLFNHSETDFVVKAGDRIAQLICEKIYYPELEEVEDLTDTQRGEGGFGSTGTN